MYIIMVADVLGPIWGQVKQLAQLHEQMLNLGTNFNEIHIKMQTFPFPPKSFENTLCKTRPLWFGLNVLNKLGSGRSVDRQPVSGFVIGGFVLSYWQHTMYDDKQAVCPCIQERKRKLCDFSAWSIINLEKVYQELSSSWQTIARLWDFARLVSVSVPLSGAVMLSEVTVCWRLTMALLMQCEHKVPYELSRKPTNETGTKITDDRLYSSSNTGSNLRTFILPVTYNIKLTLSLSLNHSSYIIPYVSNSYFVDESFNTLRLEHFAEDIISCIFLNANVWILNDISLESVSVGLIGDQSVWIWRVAWYRAGASHYPNQWWPNASTHTHATRHKWTAFSPTKSFKSYQFINVH